MVGISLTEFSSQNDEFETIFFDNIEESMAKQLSNKIHITLSMGVTGKKLNSGAIIPLMEHKLISYAVIFKMSESGNLFSLSFTVDSDNQLTLYKRIPILETLSKDFIFQISEKEFSKDPAHIKEIMSEVIETSNDLFLMESLAEDKERTNPLKQLITRLGKNIHVFYRSILLNEKVVIVADSRTEYNILNYPWNEFVPHKTLKILPWPKNPDKEIDFDIMIIEKEQKKQCELDCVKLDLDLGVLEHGKSDKYLENFFIYLKDIKHGLSIELNLEVNSIFNWVHEIIELCTTNKDTNIDDKIKELIKFHTKTRFGNRLPLITSIARNYNEFTSDKIITYFLKELGIFDKDVKRIDSRKLLSKL